MHWTQMTKDTLSVLRRGSVIPAHLLALDADRKLDARRQRAMTRYAQVTDCNAALFDVVHDFHGCIAGCHEILRRQGLLEGTWCLDPDEGLGNGQAAELTRVAKDFRT